MLHSENLDILEYIHIKGARANNLKNIEIKLPKDNLIVVSGVSGSGKSTITMDTLYAEGQRRYVESLSSYARQFMDRMKKPEVDFIKGICPAIAVEQKVSTSNARSTVGTLTEIYDLFRLLFARVGKTISPVSGNEVVKHQVTDVVNHIGGLEEGARCYLYIPLQKHYPDRLLAQELSLLVQKGYTRLLYDGGLIDIQDHLDERGGELNRKLKTVDDAEYRILIDRFIVKSDDEELIKRVADSVQTAFDESFGSCIVSLEGEEVAFNNRFELDGIEFIEPAPQLFNYNNPFGACPVCEGYGKVIGIDEEKVIPDPELSVYDGTVSPWKGEMASVWQKQFIRLAAKLDFPVHRSYRHLTQEEKDLLWNGNHEISGINQYFEALEEKSYKIQNRVIMARYRGRTTCHACKGGRLRKEAMYVKIQGHTIADLVNLSIKDLMTFFEELKFSEHDTQIASRILVEITNRLGIMNEIGLGYLHLDRLSSTLSGGEIQRINLTRTLGSNLTSSLYVLDEPSIGLHPRDTIKLVNVLQKLKSLGNTVVVVEHEEDIIRQADYLLDMGPLAGSHGGEVVYAGNFREADPEKNPSSLTVQYLHHKKLIATPKHRRKVTNKILVQGARQHNLKDIDVTLPLNALTVITGVSGSGKSTLVDDVIVPAIQLEIGQFSGRHPGTLKSIGGDVQSVNMVEMIGQSPIGRSSRSNPVTYVKAFDGIRDLFSKQQLSRIRGYKPSRFSFNVEGGRCETCKGDGEILVEMQFLADVQLTCEDCQGQRFKKEILEVEYKGKNIFDVLNMSIEDALKFFKDRNDIYFKLKPLDDVGLGYVKLGQSSSTLSGGEAQRVKLASYLSHSGTTDKILFVFDEPTTGLHFQDVEKLLAAFNQLIEQGHTVVVVEHHLDVVKSADWVIDLGPEAGLEGGNLVFEGKPEDLVHCEASYTGKYLREKWESEGVEYLKI